MFSDAAQDKFHADVLARATEIYQSVCPQTFDADPFISYFSAVACDKTQNANDINVIKTLRQPDFTVRQAIAIMFKNPRRRVDTVADWGDELAGRSVANLDVAELQQIKEKIGNERFEFEDFCVLKAAHEVTRQALAQSVALPNISPAERMIKTVHEIAALLANPALDPSIVSRAEDMLITVQEALVRAGQRGLEWPTN